MDKWILQFVQYTAVTLDRSFICFLFFDTLRINLCIFVSSEFLTLSNHIEILK